MSCVRQHKTQFRKGSTDLNSQTSTYTVLHFTPRTHACLCKRDPVMCAVSGRGSQPPVLPLPGGRHLELPSRRNGSGGAAGGSAVDGAGRLDVTADEGHCGAVCKQDTV